jgi:hypothetical protein
MMESIIECSLELFFISTTCIFSSDEKGKIRGSISRRMKGSFRGDFPFGFVFEEIHLKKKRFQQR